MNNDSKSISREAPIVKILARLEGVIEDKKHGAQGFLAFCPAHHDGASRGRQSLHITPKENGDVLLHCFAGCSTDDILRAIGLSVKDLFVAPAPNEGRDITATYDYCDVTGQLLFQVVRFEPKGFAQRRPDPAVKGGWVWNVREVRQVPYRLPELMAALDRGETVYVVEGEKDADALARLGLVATCNAGGAGKWTKAHSEYFTAGAQVVILPDNDDPGQEHARKVAGQLVGRGCRVKVLGLPGLPEKGDVSDWLAAGGTREQLLELVEQTPEWQLTKANLPGVEPVELDVVLPWPEKLEDEALYGLAGDVVRAIDPYSEADPAALLISFLVAFGNLVGRRPHFVAGADKHYLNIFAALVGESAKGRKGMSWSWTRELCGLVDEKWARHKTPSGLSTGEGLIWAVRDKIIVRQPVKEKGRVVEYQEVEIDPGVDDKRLLVIEPELASALKVMTRQGNTLSPLIRRAWDSGDLISLTKNSPARATGAHISIMGHITRTELIQTLTENEQANGFANRFLWVCVRRSKYLPDGTPMPLHELNYLAGRVHKAVQFANTVDEIKRNQHANEIWRAVYPSLSEGKPGLLGAVTGRAEAQVMRLACIYALLDLSHEIKPEHLGAALAFWKHCEESARFIFGDSVGDQVADTILDALKCGPMSQTDINNLFGKHIAASVLKETLQRLSALGKINHTTETTRGRPKILWRLAG